MKLRILYIEDSEVYQQLVGMVIRTMIPMADMVSATTLQDALKLASLQNFDLFLVDLDLPDSSGIQTLEKLANGVPSVVLSGTDDPKVIKQAARLGAMKYLVKADSDALRITDAILAATSEQQRTARFQAAIRSVTDAVDAFTLRAKMECCP